MFYLTTHSTHFIYGYMGSDIWLRTILIGYSFRLTARVILYAPSHRQDSTYHGLCYTSRGALAGTRNSSEIVTTVISGMPLLTSQGHVTSLLAVHNGFSKRYKNYRFRSDCSYSLVPASADDSSPTPPPPPHTHLRSATVYLSLSCIVTMLHTYFIFFKTS